MCKIGDKIRIVDMDGEPNYTGRVGIVERIGKDPWGGTQIHGTWGGLALYEGEDEYEIIESV